MPEVSLEVLTHLSLRSMTLENKKTYLAPGPLGSSVGRSEFSESVPEYPHFGYEGVLTFAASGCPTTPEPPTA